MKCFFDIIKNSIKDKANFIVIIFFSIIWAVTQVYRSLYVGKIIEKLKISDIIRYIIIVIVAFTSLILMQLLVNKSTKDNNERIFNSLIKKFMNIKDFREIINLNRHVISNINESLIFNTQITNIFFMNFTQSILMIIITIGIFYFYVPKISLFFTGFFVVIIGIYYLLFKNLEKRWDKYWSEYNRCNKSIQNIMLNIWNIKYNSFEKITSSYLKNNFSKRSNKFIKFANGKTIVGYSPMLIFFIIIIASLFIIAKSKDLTITIRVFIIFQLFKVWNEFCTASTACVEMYHAQKNIEMVCPIWFSEQDNLSEGEKIGKINNIKFSNVSFSYGKNNVINNKSFEIKSGENVLLYGKSGNGKSTVVNLICRLYSLDKNCKGDILINGKSIDKINLKKLRDRISVVPQNIMVFNGNIKDNIVLDRKYDQKKLEKLLKLLNLPSINFNAKNLSQGQKQRVLIARALYDENKSVYIFDEYLSNLDKNTAHNIHNYVMNYIKKNNKIGIFILHNAELIYSTGKIINI